MRGFIKASNQTNSSFLQAVQDLLTGKDLNEDTPFHILAELRTGANSEKMEQLLLEKDDDFNTPLHLASRSKRIDIPPLLDFVKKKTPFSGAVAIGSMELVKEMLQGLTLDEKRMMVKLADFSNTSLLHVAPKYGHVDVFNLLLVNGANITRKGPEKHTALDVAIKKDQSSLSHNQQLRHLGYKISPSGARNQKSRLPVKNKYQKNMTQRTRFCHHKVFFCWLVFFLFLAVSRQGHFPQIRITFPRVSFPI